MEKYLPLLKDEIKDVQVEEQAMPSLTLFMHYEINLILKKSSMGTLVLQVFHSLFSHHIELRVCQLNRLHPKLLKMHPKLLKDECLS